MTPMTLMTEAGARAAIGPDGVSALQREFVSAAVDLPTHSRSVRGAALEITWLAGRLLDPEATPVAHAERPRSGDTR